MDRNVVIATVLIAGILFAWMYFLSPPPPPPGSVGEPFPEESQEVVPEEQMPAAPRTSLAPAAIADTALAQAQQGAAQFIVVDSDLYQAKFSTKGGTLVSFELKEYYKFDQETPVQLVSEAENGALGLVFTTPQSHLVDTRSLFFAPSFSGDTLRVTEGGATLAFEAQLGAGTIRQTYSFVPDEYEVGLAIDQINAETFATTEGYELTWSGGLPFTEKPSNREAEAASLAAYARSGGEVEGITLDGEETEDKTLRGSVQWISVKNKYFAAVVIPEETPRAAELVGEKFGTIDDGSLQEIYRVSLLMPPAIAGQADTYKLYLGPLEFYRITDYGLGLYGMVDYGWDAFEWVTRPLAKFLFIPLFTFLGGFLPNYGLVIIVFAILIKALVYPLTKSSYRSMAQMRELQPKMQEIKEKYGDDPQKQQEAMMKMYKETGVNPIGGCLPMLLQYPIIIALWQFLQQSIEIRQEGFLWATDLSAPDVILNLPFSLPLYGDYVAGFTVLMGLSMVVQMRIQSTPASGMQAKIFMYVMPVMLFVIFNSLPSGLSLYYLCYNVLTAVQQKFINNSLEKEKEQGGTDGKAAKKKVKAPRKAKISPNGKAKKGGKTKKVRSR